MPTMTKEDLSVNRDDYRLVDDAEGGTRPRGSSIGRISEAVVAGASVSCGKDAQEDTFSYVFIPCDGAAPLERRVASAAGGLESDDLLSQLRAGSEMGPAVDIIAITVPTPATSNLAVSLYKSQDSAHRPENVRATGLLNAAGLALPPGNEIRGDVAVSRYFDNDDAWKRVDLEPTECASDAAWVRASKALKGKRSVSGNSLSSILQQQSAAGMAGGGAPAAAVAAPPQPQGPRIEAGGVTWTETNEEAVLVVPLPDNVSRKQVKATFHTDSIRIAATGHATPLVEAALANRVDVDGCTWQMADGGGAIEITLEKGEPNRPWSALFA